MDWNKRLSIWYRLFAFASILVLYFMTRSIASGEDPEMMLSAVRLTPKVKEYHTDTSSDQDSEKVLSRFGRSSQSRYNGNFQTCRYPSTSEDSDIFCVEYPSKFVCNQTCMFGYTLKDGRKRTMKCRKEEDEWTPVRRFEQCKPFVDCTISLGPGGKMKCLSHFMDHGPVCDISCQHYEDQPAVPMKSYKCDIRGNWSPKLPFCASPGSGLDLVPYPPDI